MATLLSPGVEVPIVNESYYGTSGAGTVPLIVIATAANKASPSGSSIAPYTAPAEANKVYLATSQRDLIQNFGNPNFYSIQGTQVHGHELNEYGLHAAYEYLKISNRAYVMRADIDLDQLRPSVTAPRGEPLPGRFWLDVGASSWGVFQSNGNSQAGLAWEAQKVLIATRGLTEQVENALGAVIDAPKSEFGENGDFAIVVTSNDNLIWEKISGTWHQINSAAWKAARPTVVRGATKDELLVTGQRFRINGKSFLIEDGLAKEDVRDLINRATNDTDFPIVASIAADRALILTNRSGGSIELGNLSGEPLKALGLAASTALGVSVIHTADAQYPAGAAANSVWVKGTKPNGGANWLVKVYDPNTSSFIQVSAPLLPFDATKSETDLSKDAAANAYFPSRLVGTLYVGFDRVVGPNGTETRPSTGTQMLRRWDGTRWEPLNYFAGFDAPTEAPQEGTYWYNTDFRVDVMVGDGQRWHGYRAQYPETDHKGVILSGSTPVYQQDGRSPLRENDLWIDTSDLENYPALYRYSETARRWKRVDITDQTTPFGITFADARQDSGVAFTNMPNPGAYEYNSEAIEDMLASDYCDPDAPDARTYPAGMLLFNTRYSTYNVKQWQPYYFEQEGYDPNTNFTHVGYDVGDDRYQFPALVSAGRWVTASGNDTFGRPYMGRKAQRALIVKAMQAAVTDNEELRSDIVYFNLMAAPAYPELLDELISLNIQQKETAFIVSDTPSRLKPTATAFKTWAMNPNGFTNGEEGLSQASLNNYAGVYYPWGLGTNIDGAEIMIPPSTIALSTIAYNDQVAYPWYAPAGFERGLVTAATTVGYLTDEGEFRSVLLNQGQRDVLYHDCRINPIAFIPGRGLVVYGQKTLSPLQSALDRINVARLTNYLKYNLDIIVKPFLFQQNDQQTRDSAKLTVERFLSGLVTLRALEDFAVLCDTSNNTPERRDRNELWIDIAIKPVKAIEFIYVPVRIRNSADSLEFR